MVGIAGDWATSGDEKRHIATNQAVLVFIRSPFRLSIYAGSNIQSTARVNHFKTYTYKDAAGHVYPADHTTNWRCNTELTFLSRAVKGPSIVSCEPRGVSEVHRFEKEKSCLSEMKSCT